MLIRQNGRQKDNLRSRLTEESCCLYMFHLIFSHRLETVLHAENDLRADESARNTKTSVVYVRPGDGVSL